MKTITIVEPFTGYPEGLRREFAAGETLTIPDDVSARFGKLIVDKGHARPVKPKQEKVS